MRRWGALLALLLPLAVAAEWRSLGTFTGTPQDVQVVDGGLVVVVSNAGTTLWRFDDTTTTLVETVPGSFVGGGVLPDGCPFGVTSTGVMTGGAACPGGQTLAVTGGTWARVRPLSADGTGVALTNSSSFDTLRTGSLLDGGIWTSHGSLATSSQRSLQTVVVGDAHIALVSAGVSSSLRMSVDAGSLVALSANAAGAFREAVPFERLGRVAVLGVVAGQLRVVPDVALADVLPAAIPGGLTPSFVGVSGNIGLVSANGTLIAPLPNSAEPQLVWVGRSDFPGAGAHRVHCADGRKCAVATDGGLVWLYENRGPPTLSVPALGLVDAGATIRLVADAGDPDLDPLFVSWAVDGGVISTASADGRSVDLVPTPGVCSGSVVATVTDGWPAFDRTVTVPFTVFERGSLRVDADATSVAAGAGPVTFSASIDGGCDVPTSISWSADGQTGSGPGFTWAVPATECSPTGRQVTVTATATWPVGAPATTTHDLVLTIAPWGAPNTPQFASPATQPAGTSRDYAPADAEHVCSMAMGFPGTELSWSFSGSGVTAVPVDGGLRVTAPQTCVPLQLVATATRQVVGDTTGRRSDAGVLVVDVQPQIDPLNASTPLALAAFGDAGVVFGSVDAGVTCLEQRVVSAEIVVSQGGVPVANTTSGVPGAWSLAVPGSCSGGRYDVEARLFEDGGFTGASVATELTLPQLAVAVGPLSVGRIDAQCGSGAAAEISLEPVPGACAAAEYTWRTLSGPALERSAGSGSALDLQTAARDFSSVGQPIVIEWTADAGFGNLEVASRTIEVGVQPFLEVVTRATPPLRREDEPVSFEVTLRNPTTCAVSGLSVTLPLSSATPLLETVLVDGARTPAQATSDGLFLGEVSVPASGHTVIRFMARPRLLSAPKLAPLVSLQGYVVSITGGEPEAPAGCGCTTSPPASVIVLALAVLVLRRRRRVTR